jgi:HAD superfamily phosphoserine phosphatase-like hydrolase
MAVSVIIPVLNESQTIGAIVSNCLTSPLVNEVIVVDDNSEDNTAAVAKAAGAKLILSKKRGKGISMKEGLEAASNEWIVFLDGDIDPYPPQTIENLCRPLVLDEADFVKGSFTRNAGRVTTLVARPLLSIFYPGLSKFNQPLSGMIAGKKSCFQKIDFFNDYGVDVGILIDMYLMRLRITEVNIGYIENKSKPWEALGKMSREVSRAIILKAQRLIENPVDEEEIQTLEYIQGEMNEVLEEQLSEFRKMVVMDMDNTILRGRFIDAMADRYDFKDKLSELRAKEIDPVILCKRIGQLLKGRTMEELLEVIAGIPMVPDVRSVVTSLKQKGYMVGIISNSYQLVCNYVKQEIGADFILANRLEFAEGKATGEVGMPSYFFPPPESICAHGLCKTHALQYACEKYHVKLENCMAVGDSADDACMIRHAGKGYAFVTEDPVLLHSADFRITEASFAMLLE